MLNHRFIVNFSKYKFLLAELVKRDIYVKYRGSSLGLLWSVLNPLLTMLVLVFIFGVLFKNDIEHFPVYVLIGRIVYAFFSAGSKNAMNSINRGANIFKKIYVPKYIYALSGILSELVTLIISLILLVLVMLADNCAFSFFNLCSIIPLFFLFIFTIGCGLILASANVFYKDIGYLYGVFTMLLMYGSAIFYPITIVTPAKYQIVFYMNPVFCAIDGVRDAILYQAFPNLGVLLYLGIVSVLALIAGIAIFYKYQDKFILHV